MIISGNKLNLVYDNWDENTNLPYEPNSKELYPNSFHMPYDAVVNGLNIQNEWIDRFKLSDVYNFPNKKFYYFITLMPNVIGENIIENKLPMLPEVIECLKDNQNFNVIIMNWQEWESFETFKLIHNWSLSVELNQSQIWVSNNNPRLDEYKNKLNSNINVYSTKYLPNIGPISIRNEVGNINFKTNKEGNLFMCHNRRIKPHRYGILCLLKKYGILNNVDWSLRHCVCLSAAIWLIDPSADCTDFESCLAFIKKSTQIQPPIIPSETVAMPSDKQSRYPQP